MTKLVLALPALAGFPVESTFATRNSWNQAVYG